MNKVISYIIACQIEFHWWFIIRYKKAGRRMIENGEPLTSPKLIRLSRKIDHHGMLVFRLEDKYENLMS